MDRPNSVDDKSAARPRHPALKQKTKTSMPIQDPAVRAHNFSVVELGYTSALAANESNRCVACKDPACVPLCPVEIDIRSMVDFLKAQDYEAAYQVIAKSNLFPSITGRVCPQESQCESTCIRGAKGEPVGIGFLEKFLGDWARERGLRPKADLPPWNGKRVAIIGSGPAGMSAAADLVRFGYKVTMFEALHRPGGVLIYGIPEFRLPKAIVDYEIDNLRTLGVQIVVNCLVGRTIPMEELEQDYDAIFIGTGAGLPYFMDIPGEQLSGVYSANEFLTRANLMEARSFPQAPTPIHVGKRVAVVGGGNVAMDGARVALRMGAEHVDIVYRRTEDEMPARRDEIHHAQEEGINFLLLHAPVAIYGDARGWVKEIELIKMELGQPDESGRRRPVPVAGSNYRLPYDVVVMAIGQGPNPLLARLTPSLKTNKTGNIVVEKQTLAVQGVVSSLGGGNERRPAAGNGNGNGQGNARENGYGSSSGNSSGNGQQDSHTKLHAASAEFGCGRSAAAAGGGGGKGGEGGVHAAAARRRPVICAGGDIIGSQAGAGGTVIAAMGHGKVAARTIHQALELAATAGERPGPAGASS
jgi:glutamate synthase (NADPH/NADH) small chain